jgi:hypothetical protein
METAQEHHKMMAEAKKLLNSAGEDELNIKKHSVVLCRRKKRPEMPWGRNNIMKEWKTGTIIKIKKSSSGSTTYHIQYSDKHVEKDVPLEIVFQPRPLPKNASTADTPFEYTPRKALNVTLIKAGLPDTALSTLRLDQTIGACSEKIQDAITNYVKVTYNYIFS